MVNQPARSLLGLIGMCLSGFLMWTSTLVNVSKIIDLIVMSFAMLPLIFFFIWGLCDDSIKVTQSTRKKGAKGK